MSLEVHIYGPGLGETIFLRWPGDGGAWRGALIDACSPDDGQWLAQKLHDLELRELEFVVATHPHLDHIEGLGAGLARAGVKASHLFYWPGLSSTYWIEFFHRLEMQEGFKSKGTAKMIEEWFGFCGDHYKVHKIGGKDTGGISGEIFSATINGKQLRVTAIGPWLRGMNKLVKNVSESIERNGSIDYEHRYANHVSIALLIEYDEAQVVLGGDMEDINWDVLMEEAKCPKFWPSVVKVSHHGSSNGRIESMWVNGAGFFNGKPSDAIAVVTPWRQGGKSLPEEDVLREICDAGYTVYVTGHSGKNGKRTRHRDSHVSIRVESDGAASVFEREKVRLV